MNPINPITLDAVPTSDWVRIGNLYDVVEVYNSGGSLRFRIVDESGTPSLWPATMFRPEDPKLPGNWDCDLLDEALTLAPRPFLEPGFWEAYYDGDPKARNRFDETLKILRGEVEAD